VFLQTEGPGQLAIGAVITFVFLLLNLTCKPFCTDGLNNLQSVSLVSQFFTLFCGILIGYMANMDKTGSDAQAKEDSTVLGSVIVLLNCMTIVFPLVLKIMSGKIIELMEMLIGVARFPFNYYMKWCGKQKRRDARIKRKRTEKAVYHEVEADLCVTERAIEVPSTLSPAYLEDRPVSAEPESPGDMQRDFNTFLRGETTASADLAIVDSLVAVPPFEFPVKQLPRLITQSDGPDWTPVKKQTALSRRLVKYIVNDQAVEEYTWSDGTVGTALPAPAREHPGFKPALWGSVAEAGAADFDMPKGGLRKQHAEADQLSSTLLRPLDEVERLLGSVQNLWDSAAEDDAEAGVVSLVIPKGGLPREHAGADQLSYRC
jgi:hypothetical protein